MITAEQKEQLEEFKPTNWQELVLQRLSKLEVLNSKGNPYPKEMLSMVYSGTRTNEAIEEAIIFVFLEEKERIIERNKKLGITTPQTA